MAPSAKSNLFDGLSFVKYMKNIGRSYRKQAVELVSISRIFAQEQEQTFRSDNALRSVLEVVDDALYSATEAQKKTSKDADKKFKKAIEALSVYETKYRPGTTEEKTVAKKMQKAEGEDKSSSMFLNRLKESARPLVEGQTKKVDFRLHKSLLDTNPTIIEQVLSKPLKPKEVLWNFSRYRDKRRVRLKQNPHFYEVLPTLAEYYGSEIQIDPIDLQTETDEKIDVLTDDSSLAGRVYLETDKEKRAFGNVWALEKAIIFRDVRGILEGEKHVEKALKGVLRLSCFEEPPRSPTPQSPNQSNSPSTTTPATSPRLPDGSWTEQIRRMLSQDCNSVNIRISCSGSTSAKPPRRSRSAGSPSQSQPPTVAPILHTHPTVTPASITAAPTHTTPLQPPRVVLPQTTVEPAPTCPISSGEVSQEESILGHAVPPQAVNTQDFPSGPVNISTGEVIDPTLAHAQHDEVVAGQVPRKFHDSGFVASPVTGPVTGPVPAPVPTSVVRTPTTPVRNHVVLTPIPTPAVPTFVRTPAPTPVVRPPAPTPVVRTPAPTPVVRTPTPIPAVRTPTPTPVVQTPSPNPVVRTPAPTPVVQTPSPNPVVRTPAPTPVVRTPAPTPAVRTPTPTPVVRTPAPTPVVQTPSPNPVVRTPVVRTPAPTPVVQTPVRTPVIPTPVRKPIVPTPIRNPVVPTPIPTPVPTKVKRSWYQKCVDVVKTGLGVG